MAMTYQPSAEILERYAKILINFALGGGKGIKAGEVVYLQSPLSALPFYRALRKQILDSGGITISGLGDDMSGAAKYFYDNATQAQLTAFLDKYYKGLVAQVDHRIAILADYDPHELDEVDPKKMVMMQKSAKPLIEWLDKKEHQGKYTWTLASYGTPAMAKEAGMKLEDYWKQIIKACYLDYTNPIVKWKQISREIERVAARLTNLKIKELHVRGKDVDLKIAIGEKRKWLGGSGRNIPSFEVFTSPDWRGTEGWIYFNQPLTKYGPKVEGIRLEFSNGRVVKSSAVKHQKFLREHLATDEGAAQVGEFSLTDRRLSRITKSMHDDLYDENMGGPYGNTHIAVGRAYNETYQGDVSKLTKSQIKQLGFNDSVIHTDMISTTDRTVTAALHGGKQKIIYKQGRFTI